jgi:circadian clock protein KaiC
MTDSPPSEGRGGSRVATGIAGLDDILGGGLLPHRIYLVEGNPGTGKTTLGLQFLLEGVRRGERVLYVTLSETAEELRAAAASHGWSLDDTPLFELHASAGAVGPDDEYTIVHPSEVELGAITKDLYGEIDRIRPSRLVIDPLSEMRLLARDALRFRHQILALKQHLTGMECTVLLLDERIPPTGDLQLQTLAHGVISLDRIPLSYGTTRRRVEVTKLRAVSYREGYHDLVIETGGIVVFPRLVAAEHRGGLARATVSSGIPVLDTLLAGGLHRGTSTLLLGPAGTGKSVIAMQYMCAAAARGEQVAAYIFDESLHTLLTRAAGLEMPLAAHIDAGRVSIQQVDPVELSPGELIHRVRTCVEVENAKLIVIDSLNGYLSAMPEERALVAQMHELLAYLNEKGVLTLLIVAQHGMVGPNEAPVDLSYLADSVILLRYFETRGEVRQAISVMKKRSGNHERTIRELRLGPGITVGPPLSNLQGVLSGSPTSAESGEQVNKGGAA